MLKNNTITVHTEEINVYYFRCFCNPKSLFYWRGCLPLLKHIVVVHMTTSFYYIKHKIKKIRNKVEKSYPHWPTIKDAFSKYSLYIVVLLERDVYVGAKSQFLRHSRKANRGSFLTKSIMKNAK